MKNKHKSALPDIPEKEYNSLVELCFVQSHSQNEYRMITYLIDKLRALGLSYYIDLIGNIIVTKGKAQTYPCIVSHMDTVHKLVNDYQIFYVNITSKHDKNIIIDRKLFAKNGDKPTGIGGDDKCGIFACLYFLEKLPAVKVVFFTREESGCVGSDNIDKSFFSDCRYIIQLDRRHSGDFIDKHFRGNTTSQAFRSECGHLKKQFGFKSTTGVITDSINLWVDGVGISCINLSAGYYEPHTDSEYIMIKELWNSIQLTRSIISTLKQKRYECLPEPVNYPTRTQIHKQCFLCKTWKSDIKGMESSKYNNQFVCFDCIHEQWKYKDYKKDTADNKPQLPTVAPLTKKATIYLRCSICNKFVNTKDGAVTSADSIYNGAFVCNECMGIQPTINNNMTKNKDLETTNSEKCSVCGNHYINPLLNGDYSSEYPYPWTCNNCINNSDNNTSSDTNHTSEYTSEHTSEYKVCDLCNKTVLESEGRDAEEHDCGFMCYECLRLYYGEEAKPGAKPIDEEKKAANDGQNT